MFPRYIGDCRCQRCSGTRGMSAPVQHRTNGEPVCTLFPHRADEPPNCRRPGCLGALLHSVEEPNGPRSLWPVQKLSMCDFSSPDFNIIPNVSSWYSEANMGIFHKALSPTLASCCRSQCAEAQGPKQSPCVVFISYRKTFCAAPPHWAPGLQLQPVNASPAPSFPITCEPCTPRGNGAGDQRLSAVTWHHDATASGKCYTSPMMG